MMEWISVKDRLPEKNTTVIVCSISDGHIQIKDFKGDEKNWITNYLEKVTHWMPLPEPPKDSTNG
jgi:hypothetical protein